MKKAVLLKKDFRIETRSYKGTGNTIYITPLIEDVKRNQRLDYSVKSTQKHSFNDNIKYYSNNGTLGLQSYYNSLETLLEKGIEYYNWAI